MSDSESNTLPEGTYRIAVVSRPPAGGEPEPARAGKAQLEIKGWKPSDIDRNAETLAGYSRSYSLLVQPQQDEKQWVALRDLSGEQLASLRRDGFEPAWEVKVGGRFDVFLRADSPLRQEERRGLVEHLRQCYDIPSLSGVLPNAVRLPGFQTLAEEPETRAQLVVANERSFSAAERVLTELRNRAEQPHIERLARAEPVPEGLELPRGLGHFDRLETLPPLPHAHPVAQLERHLHEPEAQKRAEDYGPNREGLSGGEMEQDALASNRGLFRMLHERPPAELVRSPEFLEVVAFEESRLVTQRWGEEWLATEKSSAAQAYQDLARATPDPERAPDAQALDRYAIAVEVAFRNERTCLGEQQHLSEARVLNIEVRTQRLAVAAAMSPRDERVLTAFRAAVEQEARWRFCKEEYLTAQPLEPKPKESLAELRGREADAKAALQAGRSGSGEPLDQKVTTWRNILWERVSREHGVLVDALRRELTAIRPAASIALGIDAEAARLSLNRYLQRLTDWSSLSKPLLTSDEPSFALHKACQRVAHNDLSPRALGLLQSELLRSSAPASLPLPPPPASSDPRELLQSFVTLAKAVPLLADQLQISSPTVEADTRKLLQLSSELIGVYQLVEKLERRHHGVAEPSPAPEGISQATWDRAWMKRAEEKGLPHPERHLGNIGPPFAPRELAMERAAALKTVEVRAVRSVTNELERRAVLR